MNLFANQIFIYFINFFAFIEIVQLELYVASFKYPANIYPFKPNNRHARTRCGINSVLFIKTKNDVIHVVVVSLLLTWNIRDTLL